MNETNYCNNKARKRKTFCWRFNYGTEARITCLINDDISSKGPKKLCIDVNSILVLLTYASFSRMKLKNAM